MYEAHFQLRQAPFSIAPDPEFLYLSDGHREALAHLTYGLNQGGFVLITGEVGTGKTTLLRNLLKQMPPDLEVAFILNPRLTVRELLETLCDELGIDYSESDRSSIKQFTDALNQHLLETHASGRSTVVIIDEAQNLAPTVLEQIRLLTNLETDKRKLLRIILLGQPELLELLARKELRQLGQRITARYHLRGLSREDTYGYVAHRLQRAGGHAGIFTRPALRRLHRISQGIPRVINLVADRAMLGAYAEGRTRVTWSMIGRAAGEVLGAGGNARRWLRPGIAVALAAGAVAAWLLVPGLARFVATWSPPQQVTDTDAIPGEPDASVESAAADLTPGDELTPADDPEAQAGPVEAAPVVADLERAPIPESMEPQSISPQPMAPQPIAPEATAQAPVTDTIHATPAADTPALTSVLKSPALGTYETQRIAYQDAFAEWGADYADAAPGTIPCDFAPAAGLQCFGGTGTWGDLRRFNVPAVLELWDESKPFYGALTAMTADSVTLRVAGTEQRFAIRDLEESWFGAYVLIWQTPPGYRGTLKDGDRHPTVRWLREQLGKLGFASTAAEPDVFDDGLHDAVLRFQTSEAIVPDGIVGPQTWIRLGQRLGGPQPTLDDR